MKKAIICFTRTPEPGKTKTRLMPYLTPDECARLHTAFLLDIAAACALIDAELFVFYCGDERGVLRGIFPLARGFFPQRGGELGQRMSGALCSVLALGYDACVLIGGDVPQLTAKHLQSGFDALAKADVTLGPTADGGYYLVGTKAPCDALFSGQSYGGGSVYQSAVAALEFAGRGFAQAMECNDIDTPDDLFALWEAIKGESSHTANCLREIMAQGERAC